MIYFFIVLYFACTFFFFSKYIQAFFYPLIKLWTWKTYSCLAQVSLSSRQVHKNKYFGLLNRLHWIRSRISKFLKT